MSRVIEIQSKETREVIYTCRYTTECLLSDVQSIAMTEVGNKRQMSTSITACVDDLPCFLAFYFYDPYSYLEISSIFFLIFVVYSATSTFVTCICLFVIGRFMFL